MVLIITLVMLMWPLTAADYSRRLTPMLVDVCDRFPNWPHCKLQPPFDDDQEVESTDTLPLPRNFLETGGGEDCKKYQLHYGYWCTTLTTDYANRPDVLEFCRKYEKSCDVNDAPSVLQKLTRAECVKYSSLAQTSCGDGQQATRQIKQLCELYKRSCPSTTSQTARTTQSESSARDLSWLQSRNDVVLGANSVIGRRMKLAQNCNTNMDLYRVMCTRSGHQRRKRSLDDISSITDVNQIDFKTVCAQYRDKANQHCTGNEQGGLKTYCDYYRSYCAKFDASANAQVPSISSPSRNKNRLQIRTKKPLSALRQQAAWVKSQDPQFCENFSRVCNTAATSQQISRLKICQDFHRTRGTFCPAYSLQQDRIGCAAYRKYCMRAPAFLNIDGIEL